MAIPDVGPVVAAGWLVAALTGAAAGGATGGIIEALSQQPGIREEEANVYRALARRGSASPQIIHYLIRPFPQV